MLVGILLIVVASAYRVAAAYLPGALPNVAPLMAFALCGGLFLPRLWAWVIPFAALLLSDALIDAHYGVPLFSFGMVATYACYAAVIAGGRLLRHRPLPFAVLGASLLASVLFYIVTNTVSWSTDPGYAKTAAGWFQALTTGLPGYPPTWLFFRNSAAGDLFFTALYLGCMALAPGKGRRQRTVAAVAR